MEQTTANRNIGVFSAVITALGFRYPRYQRDLGALRVGDWDELRDFVSIDESMMRNCVMAAVGVLAALDLRTDELDDSFARLVDMTDTHCAVCTLRRHVVRRETGCLL